MLLTETYGPAIIRPPMSKWRLSFCKRQGSNIPAQSSQQDDREMLDTEDSLVQLAATVENGPLQPNSGSQVILNVLMRPIRMFLGEPLVFFTDMFLVLVYALFFLSFEAYPIIFEGLIQLSKHKVPWLKSGRDIQYEPGSSFPCIFPS